MAIYSIYSWWWVRLSPETCRVKPLRIKNAIVASCWTYFTNCALSWNVKLIITKMHGQQHIKTLTVKFRQYELWTSLQAILILMVPVDVECHFQLVRMGLCGVEGPSYRLKQHNLSNTGSVYLLRKHWIKTVYDERQRGQACIVCNVQTSDSLHWRCTRRGKKKSSRIFHSPFSLFNSFLYSLAYLQARPHSVVWRENKSQFFFILNCAGRAGLSLGDRLFSSVRYDGVGVWWWCVEGYNF